MAVAACALLTAGDGGTRWSAWSSSGGVAIEFAARPSFSDMPLEEVMCMIVPA